MVLQWLLSSTVRQATGMRKHVIKLLNAQRDILSPQAIEGIQAAIKEMDAALASKAGKEELKKQMGNLEAAANKWLKPYPHANIRENVEVLLVALVVALGIRTFFLQPFKIPTGSMQPTLYGITPPAYDFAPVHEDFKMPGFAKRLFDRWAYGITYHHIVAHADGQLYYNQPKLVLPFVSKQEYQIGGVAKTLWFPPDQLFERAGARPGEYYRKGQDMVKLRVKSGDHLFVDRFTYNFRHPERGEIIVFKTLGIEALPQDQFYIKRLVALGGEHVRIDDDRHLYINGEPLDASTPRFENVYSFDPNESPQDSQYSGHVDGPRLAPLFFHNPDGVKVRPNHYMVMGDNTVNSLDSRAWGDFSRTNVIGKAWFVYWPISERFGWGYR